MKAITLALLLATTSYGQIMAPHRPQMLWLMGQSITDGRSTVNELSVDDAGPVTDGVHSAFIWTGAQFETLAAGANSQGQDWGPEIPIGWHFVRERHENIFIVKVSSGGASLTRARPGYRTWAEEENDLYLDMVTWSVAAIDALTTPQTKPRILGAVWPQGAAEANGTWQTGCARAAEYGEHYALLIESWRSIVGCKALWIDIQTSGTLPAPPYTCLTTLRAQKAQTIAGTVNAVQLPWTYALQNDGVHPSAAGNYQIAADVVAILPNSSKAKER